MSVSVIIPAYDSEATIGPTLDSVAAQTWDGDLEVIVVDDGSTDATAEVAAAHELSPRVVSQQNTGVVGARRRGIEEATGEWIAFLDADDRWLPEKLATQLPVARRQDRPCLSFTRYRRVADGDGEVDQPIHPEVDLDARPCQLPYRNFIGNSTVLVHRACLERADLYPDDPTLNRGGQDYALWLRIAAYFPLVYVPEVLTEYGVHADNRIGTDPVAHLEGGLLALKNFHDWAPDRFAGMAGAPYSAVVAYRMGKFLRDAVVYRDVWPSDAVPRALQLVTQFSG